MKYSYIFLILAFAFSQDYSLSFDGVNDYVDFGVDLGPVDNSDFTIEFWVFANNAESYREIFSSESPNFYIGYAPDDLIRCNPYGEALSEFPFNYWHNITLVKTEDTVRLFIDGINRHEFASSQVPSWSKFKIGKQFGTHGEYWDGFIDEMRISNIARYSDNFSPQLLFDNDSYTRALWHFDEGDGGTLIDHSGNDNDGIINGNPIWSTNVPGGCTNPAACNYNAAAIEDDGSCLYFDCAAECGGSAIVDECGVCEGDNSSCGGCTDMNAQNYDEEALIDDGSCIYLPEISITPDSLHFDVVVFEDTLATQILTITNDGFDTLEVELTNQANFNYSDDFENGIGPNWNTNYLFTTPDGLNTFHGRFADNNENATVFTLSNVPVDEFYLLDFELFIIDTWDGNSQQDWWQLIINGDEILYTTFSNCPTWHNNNEQSYPGNYPSSNPGQTGASLTGSFYGWTGDNSIYSINHTFINESEEISIEFISGLTSPDNDESWGIDNFNLSFQNSIEWLTFSETTLTIPPGESADIEITANASGYEFGDYEGSININSNDPENPSIEIPVSMSVQYPVAEASVNELYFEESFNSVVYSDFEITNSGNYPLTVNASLSHPYLSVEQDSISIEPDSAAVFRVYFNSTLEEIEFSDNLILTYNDPFNSSDAVVITGKVVPDVRPIITSIDDVPNDQGGWVTVSFTRSVHDTDSLRVQEIYGVEIDDGSGWMASTTQIAYGESNYTALVPTTNDSSATTDGVIYFRVIASMEEGNFASDVVTGYSIDNIHPTVPTLMSAEHEIMDVSLNWQYELEEDFAYHRITSLNSTDNTISNEHSFTLNGHDEHWVNSVDYNGNYSDNTESIMSINLHAGANLKSFNVLPDDNSITNVMASIEGNATGVIGEGVAANYMEGSGWMGSLSVIQPRSGYWIMVSEDDVLLLMGEPTSRDLAYILHEGANLISYPFRYSTVLEEAIPDDAQTSITGIIGEGVAANHMNGNWMGSLSHLDGSNGYWFKTSSDISLTFNGCDENCSELSRSIKPAKLEEYEFAQSTKQAFYFIESVESIQAGDWILAYNGDKVIGARQWTGNIIDVPAMGTDGSYYTKGYIKTGEVPSFKILRDDELIDLEGDIPAFENNQLYMVSSLTEAVVLPETFSLDRAYPNPFNPTTTLSFAIPIDSEVSLSVYNLQGREVSTLIDANMDAGYHSVVWDANSYASGVYFVKMIAGEFVNTQKLMLVK